MAVTPAAAAVTPAAVAGEAAAGLAGTAAAVVLTAGAAAALAVLLARLTVGPLDRLLRRRYPARNWLGEEVTVAGGLAVATGSLGGLALLLVLLGAAGVGSGGGDGLPVDGAGSAARTVDGFGWGLLAAAAAASLGGLVDDLAGGAGPRGLRAHLRALLGRRPGAGAVKAAALLLAGAVVARPALAGGRLLEGATVVTLVALAGNAVNLLDVRPGRAAKAFLAGGLALVAGVLVSRALGGDGPAGPSGAAGGGGGAGGPALLLVPFLAAAAAHLPLDLGRRTMLGDTGANLLGVAAGAVLAEVLDGPARLAVLVLLASLHVLGETVSLSVLIERSPFLRWLDGLGRDLPSRRG